MICTHRLDVQFYGTEQQGLLFQNRIAEYCKSELLRKLEARFDHIAGPDHFITIDRLEVEVSGNAASGFDDHLAQALAGEVIAALEDKIARVALQPGQVANTVQTSGQEELTLQTNAQHAADTLIYFLDCGRLPWNVRMLSGQSLEQYLADKIQDLNLPASHAAKLEKMMAKADARKRLIQSFTPGFVQQILRQLPSLPQLDIPEHVSPGEKKLRMDPLQATPNSADPRTPSNTEEKQAQTSNRQKTETTLNPPDTNDRLKTRPIVLHGEGIFIANSGLVLLHPFLPQLFETLHVVHDNTLADPGIAMQVLHYSCTGQRMIPEYELVLPKILCGIAVDAFVDPVDPLRDDQCDEIARMMQAVIQHWSALRNTSIAGIQETFLQRAGKLMWDPEKGWALLVEVKTFDILLDYLPWGFSRIKLPWMKELLHVQWDHQQLS